MTRERFLVDEIPPVDKFVVASIETGDTTHTPIPLYKTLHTPLFLVEEEFITLMVPEMSATKQQKKEKARKGGSKGKRRRTAEAEEALKDLYAEANKRAQKRNQ